MSSVLLEEIRKTNRYAADELKKADFVTDSDIQSLTRDDLHELFPGAAKIKLRRSIFDIIHKPRPIDVLIRELKDFIPHESFRAALTNNGVLVEYLHILKDMKTQMNCVQSFLDAHIGLLEELSKSQPYQESDKGTSTSDTRHPGDLCNDQTGGHPQRSQNSLPGTGTLDISGQMVSHNDQTGGHPQRSQNSLPGTGTLHISGQMVSHNDQTGGHPQRSQRNSKRSPQDFREVNYQKIVTGKTFNADLQLMDKVKSQAQDRVQHRFTESSEDYQITIVFCPISSRIGTDVEAAITNVQGNKPVILVLMHHAHEPKYTTSMRTWHDNPEPEVVLHVNVFYHETMRGLLICQQNIDAVSEIRKKLLEYGIWRSQDTSENAPLSAESGSTGSTGKKWGIFGM